MSEMSEQQQIETVLTRGVAEVLPNKAGLAKLMSERKIRLYLGIDPTGSLLTLGHSVVLRKLQQFADLGHEVILLIGGGTVKIGDPTGRDSTRPELTNKVIEANFQNWQSQASKILNFDQIKIMNNADWLDKLTYVDLVKLLAQTTIQQLMERDMFQERLKNSQPIHGHEIIYPLMQGYDSVVMDVDLEIGGTDQTFNMMMGRTLQKTHHNKEKWVVTTPIINGLDGRKMSKSYGNFVALTDEPNDMYGKIMSIDDDMIVDYLTVLTDEPQTAIEEIQRKIEAGKNPMQFKKQLAKLITAMYHDLTKAEQAEAHFATTIQQKTVSPDSPVVQLAIDGQSKLTLGELLKLCLPQESGANCRRLVEQGAVELIPSGQRPTDWNYQLSTDSIQAVRVGKKQFFKIQFESK